ncbi:hypothetical protein ACHAWX_001972 [Stephanocyclus meneghinianus]
MSEHDNQNRTLLPTTPRKKRVVKAALIDHTYNDYSTYHITNEDRLSQQNVSNSASFPQKLHYILSRPEYRHIISWMPHGRAWRILDKKLLVSVVCKEQFKHEKFESFNRQVNGWGFKRLLRSGPDYKCYYNQYFLRGLPHLTRHMNRLDKPGKRLPNKLEEPDLYEISMRFPLPDMNARTVARDEVHSSRRIETNALTASHEPHPPMMLKFDYSGTWSKADAVCATFPPTWSLPKVVSRANSENKISQWQPESEESHTIHEELSPSLTAHTHYHDVSRSSGNDLPFSCNTFEFGQVSTDYYGSEENYNAEHYCENRFGDKEHMHAVHQEHYMLPSHRKFDHYSANKYAAFHEFVQDNELKTHAVSNTYETDYCAKKRQSLHLSSHRYEDHHCRMKEKSFHDNQNCIETPEDAFECQYYQSNKHHAWSSHAQGHYPPRTRSWYQHPLAHHCENNCPVQERWLRDCIGSTHDPKNYGNESSDQHLLSSRGLSHHAFVAVQKSYPRSKDSLCDHQLQSRIVVHSRSSEHEGYYSGEHHVHTPHGLDPHDCPCNEINCPSQVKVACSENQILPQSLGNHYVEWSTRHPAFEDNGKKMKRSTSSCNSVSSFILNDSFFEFEESASLLGES